MNKGEFLGTSRNADFGEALTDAIQKAKESMASGYITWKLVDMVGEQGGFVSVNRLMVTILAEVDAS